MKGGGEQVKEKNRKKTCELFEASFRPAWSPLSRQGRKGQKNVTIK